jgi:LacI family transcriptional regulator
MAASHQSAPRAAATMSDVAKLAGVSLKSVSRVVNNGPNVTEQLRQRVTSAIAELGFRRNEVAAHLASGGPAASIGLVIEDIEDPFYARLVRGVERVANEHRHLLLVCSSEQEEGRERELTEALLSRRVAGLIIVPSSADQRHLVDDLAAGVPMVFADRPATGVECDAVVSDNAGGVREGVHELVRQGHRRIAFIGTDRNVWTNTQRLNAYRRCLRRSKIDVDNELIKLGPLTQDAAFAAVVSVLGLPDPATAVFAQNSALTIGAWKALRGRRDVALIGFDDFELAGNLSPAVTVIAQDPSAIGMRAAELLFERMQDKTRAVRRIVLPTDLLVRDSSRPKRSGLRAPTTE